jgi:hypothetical protein
MSRQKTPHTNSQQNTTPQQSDFEPGIQESESGADEENYSRNNGAETGSNRSPRKVQTRSGRHRTEPETTAHEGRLSSRTSATRKQGITSRSAEEESKRQSKVVKNRQDGRAGINSTKRAS